MDGGTNVTDIIIGAAVSVHREIGPGLLESTYEACLAHELAQRHVIDCGYRIDLLVGNEVVVELKAVERVMPITKRSR